MSETIGPAPDFNKSIISVALSIAGAKGARQGGGFLSPGDVADLRRGNPTLPPPAFWRLMTAFVHPVFRSGDKKEMRWGLVCKAMAVMSPHIHDAFQRPGAALCRVDFASVDRSMRINRLLRADGEAFDDLLLSAARVLAAKAQPVDWRSFGRLIVERSNADRRILARDFFNAATRPEPATSTP